MTIAFDIYGTLIDPLSLGGKLQEMLGTLGSSFNALWRDKQLEYSFRKAVMKHFNHFSECTSQALDYCDTFHDTGLSVSQKEELLGMYRKLPAYAETMQCLTELKKRGHELVAFSNGKKDDLMSLFQNANIINLFDQIVSVDEVRTFKPAPEVYELLKKKATSSEIWLVSANSFDIIGAAASNLKTIWIKRSNEAVFDPFGFDYSYACDNLVDILELIELR